MAETQLDRIESMLQIIVQATTTIGDLDGTVQDRKDLKNKVKEYKVKKV